MVTWAWSCRAWVKDLELESDCSKVPHCRELRVVVEQGLGRRAVVLSSDIEIQNVLP